MLSNIIEKLKSIQKHTYSKTYIVGGTIRDHLLKRNLDDIDIVVADNAKYIAENMAQLLKGKVVVLDDEFETYRIIAGEALVDVSKMKGNNIEEDLFNRDFTMNAMAYDIEGQQQIDENSIIDPYNGLLDLKRKKIRHVNDSTFLQDPIRMLRAPRFMSQLEFDLDVTTERLIKENAALITTVAGERISHELMALLKEDNSYYYISYMDKNLHILDKIFPEISRMKEIGECKYHVVDSWTHSIYTVKIAESVIYAKGYFKDHIREAYELHSEERVAGSIKRLQLIKLGALFHDIGKPSAMWVDETGRTRFKGHEKTGEDLVLEYSKSLRLSNKETELLRKYVSLHMIPLVLYKTEGASDTKVYEAFKEMGKEVLDILLIALADIIATRRLLNPYEDMDLIKAHIEDIADKYLTRYKPIENISSVITGEEIMKELNIPEGQRVGYFLEEVRKAVYLKKIPPQKESALEYLRKQKDNII